MSSETGPGNLIVISAPSGAGKTSLASRVLEDREVEGLKFSISHTTRRPRLGECDGVDYFFVTVQEFRRMIGQDAFLEHARVYGSHYYGTSRAFVDAQLHRGYDVLLDIDVQGALQVQRQHPEALMIFVFPPSFHILEKRLRNRGLDDEEEIRRRLQTAAEEICLYDRYSHVIVNEDLEKSILELKSIIVAARCQLPRNAERAQRICRTFEPHAGSA
ncbi:MAG: guanylate kinase [Acidobacteriota bacterium]